MTDLPANAIRLPKRPPLRLVDCQGERSQEPPHVRLMDQLKAVKSGLDSGLSVAEIRRFERERCLARIRTEASALALFETPTLAANALRSVADELEGSDVA